VEMKIFQSFFFEIVIIVIILVSNQRLKTRRQQKPKKEYPPFSLLVNQTWHTRLNTTQTGSLTTNVRKRESIFPIDKNNIY
jgi:hypothetical protein